MLTESTRPQLADLHIDALALDWQRRDRLLRTLDSDFGSLLRWDTRLAANFDALIRLAPHVRENLANRLAEPLTRKEVFVVASVGLSTGHGHFVDAAIGLAQSLPAMQEPLLAALAWSSEREHLRPRMNVLPAALRLRILANDAWRVDSQPEWWTDILAWMATLEPEPDVVQAALHLVRCLGDEHRAWGAANYIGHEDPAVRMAAASTLVALAAPEHAIEGEPVLEALARETFGDVQEAALQCLALHCPQRTAALLESDVAAGQRAISRRLCVTAHGWMGRVAAVPFLTGCLDERELARPAAVALGLITGSDPRRDGWLAEPPASIAPGPDNDNMPERDPDAGLPWPDRAGFVRWWATHHARFNEAQTYLCGLPTDTASLACIIRQGPLAARRLAAERLQRVGHRPLFPTGLPAQLQQSLFPTLL